MVVVTSLSGTLAVRFRDEARSQVSLDFFLIFRRAYSSLDFFTTIVVIAPGFRNGLFKVLL